MANDAVYHHSTSESLTASKSTTINWEAPEEPPPKKRFYSEEPEKRESFEHAKGVLACLNELRRKGQFCDVTLQVGQTKIPAHRAVLVSCSPYFVAMFSHPVIESRSECITINDVDADAMIQLIEFMYTGEILVEQENSEALLSAAALLQVSFVQDACCRFLESQLRPDNCLGIARFAKWHNCTELTEAISYFIQDHLSDVAIESDEFVALPVTEVEEMISSDHLTAYEDEVFEGVCRWLEHNVENRQNVAKRLFQHIRFELLSRKYLTEFIQRNKLFETNPWCKDIVLELASDLLPSANAKRKMALIQSVALRRASEYLLVFNEWNGPKQHSLDCFEFPPNRLCDDVEELIVGPIPTVMHPAIPDIPRPRQSFDVATLQGRVYIIGGSIDDKAVSFMDVYVLAQYSWKEGPELQHKRGNHGVTVLNGKIYAIGGYDDERELDSAEVFDVTSGSWQYIAPMSCPRQRLGVASLGDRIYAVGGQHLHQFLSTAEYYDSSTNSWTAIARMLTGRCGLSVTALNDRLYVFGGEIREKQDTQQIEYYSPEKDQWKFDCSLHHARYNACSFARRGLLYVVGGNTWTLESDAINTIEIYDPRYPRMYNEFYQEIDFFEPRAAVIFSVQSNVYDTSA